MKRVEINEILFKKIIDGLKLTRLYRLTRGNNNENRFSGLR